MNVEVGVGEDWKSEDSAGRLAVRTTLLYGQNVGIGLKYGSVILILSKITYEKLGWSGAWKVDTASGS